MDSLSAAATEQLATLGDLRSCYRLFLNREPDQVELENYAAVIRRGVRVDELAWMFITCPEFAGRAATAVNPAVTRTSLPDFELFVPCADAVVGEEILAQGVYEPHVTSVMADLLREGQVMIDVGANVGYFTLLASRKVGAHGKVLAVEPLRRNLKLLVANKLVNRADNVTVLPFAVSAKEDVLTLFSIGSIASSREARLADVLSVSGLEVAYCTTLDEIAPAGRSVDVIKIDIDGHDHLAMCGARRVLERDHPHIFAEFAPDSLVHFSGVESSAYLNLFLAAGYNDFTVLSRSAQPVSYGVDVVGLSRLPAELNTTHVDLLIRRL